MSNIYRGADPYDIGSQHGTCTLATLPLQLTTPASSHDILGAARYLTSRVHDEAAHLLGG